MTLASRVAVRAALGWLVAAMSGGVLIASAQAGAQIWAPAPQAHALGALLGFFVQFALGVATWLLPRPAATGSRGDSGWRLVAIGALNAGLAVWTAALCGVSLPAHAGALLFAAGVCGLATGLVPRIRAFGT